MTDKEKILDRLERFCLSMNSFTNNDFALLVSETAIIPGVDDFCKTVNSRFVHSKLCCNTHAYLQEISLSDPFEILVRQFVQQQHQSIGTVSERGGCCCCIAICCYLLWNTHSFVFRQQRVNDLVALMAVYIATAKYLRYQIQLST